MAKNTHTVYSCDCCGVDLSTCTNEVTIVTEKPGRGQFWSRLLVSIDYHHGLHNDGSKQKAELCQACAAKLFTDAAKRVQAGERASEGVESAHLEKFED